MAITTLARSCPALPLSATTTSTTHRLYTLLLRPHTPCRFTPSRQHIPTQRTYATAKAKFRPKSLPKAHQAQPPPRAAPSPRTKASHPPQPPPFSPAPRAPYIPASAAYASLLSAKPSPTLLYLAPSSNTYMLTCYALSGFCVAYGAFNFYDNILAPQHTGLWWAIPVSIGGISLMAIALGVRVAMSARRLVKTITAVPVAGNSPVHLRLEARTLLGGMLGRGAVVEVPLHRARLSRRVAGEVERKPLHASAGDFEARREEEERRRKAREYELAHLWSAPFRHFAAAGGRVVGALQRLVWRDGFVQVVVDGGQVWRVDAKAGWALDEGVALDRLIGPKGNAR